MPVNNKASVIEKPLINSPTTNNDLNDEDRSTAKGINDLVKLNRCQSGYYERCGRHRAPYSFRICNKRFYIPTADNRYNL